MPIMKFQKSFVLKRDNGTEQYFQAGTHDVSEEDAKHWYVQTHTDTPPDLTPATTMMDLSETVPVKIIKQFTLTRDDFTTALYRPGEFDMPKIDAEHWYAKQHMENPPDPEFPPGTPQYAEMLARKEADARLERLVKDQAVHHAAEQARTANASVEQETEEDEPETDDDRRNNKRRRRSRKSGDEKIAEAETQANQESDIQRNDKPEENTGEWHG